MSNKSKHQTNTLLLEQRVALLEELVDQLIKASEKTVTALEALTARQH